MTRIEKLRELGYTLPPPFPALGSYAVVTTEGPQVFVSGLGPVKDGKLVRGLVGDDMTLAEAQDAARLTMLMILASLEKECGLDRIARCLRLTVYVRAVPSFEAHPKVADGASDLVRDLFGADVLPARSALGVHSLPMGIPVEIDSIFSLTG
ncbi:RidA family protein [Luteibacter aegosomaticola]|uniref:RidA family protein n=1 Tax=Luteibacter aegosomaticola TaxID=2911538 RepID=UPI001FF7656C|nr:RidA family protein [Luteibacter aegosomaticola]UPG89322.1 RidA family protein [Luteibacter aegosomaticola]